MLWWKVQLDDDGKVTECSVVEAADQGSATILYVQGENVDQAIDCALVRFKRWRAQHAAIERQRYKKRQRNGVCRNCSRKLAPDSKKFCPVHMQIDREYHQRYREQGAIRPRVPLDPTEALEYRQQSRRRRDAYRVSLPDVLAKFDELDRDRPWSRFREWLLLEISGRSGAPRNDIQQAAE